MPEPAAALPVRGLWTAPVPTRRPPADRPAPPLAARPSASGPRPTATASPASAMTPRPSSPSNIVPIRPGALDSLAREMAPGLPAESVELSRSERDAFREIARALVGRAPASRDEPLDERAATDNRRELRNDTSSEQPADRQVNGAGSRGADGDEVRRNAGAVLDRLPVGALVARDGQRALRQSNAARAHWIR